MTSSNDAPKTLHPHDIPEIARGGGVRTRPLVGKWTTGASNLTTGITGFTPGTSIAQHTHNVEETVMILEGDAAVFIADQRYDLTAGDVTWVPSGVPHYFMNRGAGPMRIYWVYAGREVTRTLTATGETFEHLSERDLNVGRST